jgi:hypothetical protein
MAKAKRKPKTRSKSKTKTKTKARPKTRSRSAAAPSGKKARGKKAPAKAKASPGRKAGTEVERTWRDYLQCRTELEKAVAAVQEAETSLAAARELERSCREVFDRTKNGLKSLLEVEPASADRPGAFDFTGRGLSVPDFDDDPPSSS